jgi:hypothetical protein
MPSNIKEIHADDLELPLVVAKLPHWRQQRILDFRLLHLVLHVQAPRHRICIQPTILQL